MFLHLKRANMRSSPSFVIASVHMCHFCVESQTAKMATFSILGGSVPVQVYTKVQTSLILNKGNFPGFCTKSHGMMRYTTQIDLQMYPCIFEKIQFKKKDLFGLLKVGSVQFCNYLVTQSLEPYDSYAFPCTVLGGCPFLQDTGQKDPRTSCLAAQPTQHDFRQETTKQDFKTSRCTFLQEISFFFLSFPFENSNIWQNNI